MQNGVRELMVDRTTKLFRIDLSAMIHALVEYNNCGIDGVILGMPRRFRWSIG